MLGTACGSISTCKLPKHGEFRVSLRSLPKYCVLLPKAGDELQLVGKVSQGRENTNFKRTGDFKRYERS